MALRLREVWAIDSNGLIVSAAKNTTQGSYSYFFATSTVPAPYPGFNWTSDSCVNGIIDFEAGAGGDLCSTGGTDRYLPNFGPYPGNNTNWWEVDLGECQHTVLSQELQPTCLPACVVIIDRLF